jgi:SAM-dependent methyltransferase/glycerol-3-phosphate cytidylyltransferase-like family protein
LLCNIAPDSYTAVKHPPLLPAAQRARVIDALKPIDYTHVSPVDTETVLRELQPTHYIKGKDWEGKLPPEQLRICQEENIQIVFLDTVRDSSTQLLQKFQAGRDGRVDLKAFEDLVFTQRNIEPDHYDADYFVSDWRQAGNDYTIETRRKIEGRHPQVVKDVFNPARVLDMGCGPGALLYLLEEVGIVADGIDFAASTRELAPPSVRDRIMVGALTDPNIPTDSYDLVICREVFEHLTVLQVREAVRNICRVSSKFAYVTTRFHPDPPTLLDVTTQFDVDPSHITLMNKDLLRLMFVLEGFRRREDLENTIDWMGKGRVLVYEKQHVQD